jgi:hypothetical protein
MSTQQFSYDTVESPYGPKLAVEFDYDPGIVSALKRLSWSRTHRSYNDPDDADAIVDYRCWLVDHTEETLEALEAQLGTAVPEEHWPGGPSNGADVRLVVPEDSAHFRVETDSERVLPLLDSAFSYAVEDAEYVDAYQNGKWDGREHLFETRFQRGPVGLLDQARALIESEGHDVTMIREAANTGRDIETDWDFGHDLRPYQRETIQGMLGTAVGLASLDRRGSPRSVRLTSRVRPPRVLALRAIHRAPPLCSDSH